MEKQFEDLSPQEKLNARFEAWLAAENINFGSSQARNNYRERVQRIIDVIRLGKPDRVPVAPRMSFFPAIYASMTLEDAMYDYAKTADVWQKYAIEFEPDIGPGRPAPGQVKLWNVWNISFTDGRDMEFHLMRPFNMSKPNI